jgi:uncharacterized protein YehS (DUF1456 family)
MSTISSNINTGAKYEISQHSTESSKKTVNNGSDTITTTNDTQDILDISAEAQNILNETQTSSPPQTVVLSGKKYYNQLKDYYGFGVSVTKKFTEYQGEDVYDEFGNLVDFSQESIILMKWNSSYEQSRVTGSGYSGSIVSSPTLDPELEAQMNRAYEANFRSYQEFFDEYLQTQKNAGKKIIEHSALGNDLLNGNTVDEYGYTMGMSNGWLVGNGYAIQNPTGDMPSPPPKPSVVRGQDGMYYYGFGYIEPSMLKRSRGATLITENTANSPTDSVVSFWSKDSVNLPGLTLTQRKTFLQTAQSILNNSGIKNHYADNSPYTLDVLEQSFVFLEKDGQTEIYLDQIISGLSQEDHEKLKSLLSNNKTLSSLAEISMKNRGNPSNTGSYKIGITDAEGNVLERDQLRLEVSGLFALMTTQQYQNMSRAEIVAYVAKNGK